MDACNAKASSGRQGNWNPISVVHVIFSSKTKRPLPIAKLNKQTDVLHSLPDPLSLSMASLCYSPVTASSSSSSLLSTVSSRRRSAPFSHFTGIKIRPASAAPSLRSFTRPGSAGSRLVRVRCEAQDTAVEAVAAVNDGTWQSLVLDSESPVLVEFWAPWCGPCRMIHPIIDELAKQYAGKLKCYKVNTDESPAIATKYGIRSIPTVIIFRGGEKKDAVIGAVPKSTLTTSIEKFL